MVAIRVKDDGSTPVVEKGLEAPFKQGEFYVFDVKDEVMRYWIKQSPGRREQLWKQAAKEKRDLRLILDSFVFKPAKTK